MSVTNRMMGLGLKTLNRFAGHSAVDKLGLRKPAEQVLYRATQTGFRTASAAGRVFSATRKLLKPARLSQGVSQDLFDITPTEEQQMLRDSVLTFSLEQLRPAAQSADTACVASDALLSASAELGFAMMGIPDELGGAGQERSVVTNALVAEAMAQGDMGLALACLAPSAVSTALVLWGNEEQQSLYLPSFTGEKAPAAALAVLEPGALFDVFSLKTRATHNGSGYILNGVKSLVPLASRAELFIIAAQLENEGPALFIVESSTRGIQVEAEPAMGLRGASTARLVLNDVRLPSNALIAKGRAEVYQECIQLSRLGWCALATGTSQAVLDYLVPYVNERAAFGEPISHRQSVAFSVANIAIELDAMRLLTYRAAGRAEQGKTFEQEVAWARRLCIDKGVQIGSEGVQLLGGHGFVKEHPVERWYRDLRAVGVMEGAVLI